MGLLDPTPSLPCRGPPDLIGEDAGPKADGDRQLVPFLDHAAFPDYGAGKGDFPKFSSDRVLLQMFRAGGDPMSFLCDGWAGARLSKIVRGAAPWRPAILPRSNGP